MAEITDDYLTQREVDTLPEGALVEITWSGGNDPRVYRINRGVLGTTYAEVPGSNVEHPVNFVGVKKPFTLVKLVKPVTQE